MSEGAPHPIVHFQHWGEVPYGEAWERQRQLQQQTLAQKKAWEAGEGPKSENRLIFCRHPHVFTLGKSGKEDHLLLNRFQLKKEGVDFFRIERGGDITYHGPGQLVGYPIWDLEHFYRDLGRYLPAFGRIRAGGRPAGEAYGRVAGRRHGHRGPWGEPWPGTQNRGHGH